MSIELQPSGAKAEFLKKLRTETAPYHTQLEEAGLSSRLMDPGLSIETYKNILKAFYGFIIPAERYYYSSHHTVFPRLDEYK
jgi:heme oxygenase